jgi:hypothetical protein
MILSFESASAAPRTGHLASVQLVIILELPLTLIGGSWMLGGRLGRREWRAAAAMTAGAVGVLAVLDPRPGPNDSEAPTAQPHTTLADPIQVRSGAEDPELAEPVRERAGSRAEHGPEPTPQVGSGA